MEQRIHVIEELRQVELPCEAPAEVCHVEAVDPVDGTAWLCTRSWDHSGPHVATYYVDDDDVTMIGLAWADESSWVSS